MIICLTCSKHHETYAAANACCNPKLHNKAAKQAAAVTGQKLPIVSEKLQQAPNHERSAKSAKAPVGKLGCTGKTKAGQPCSMPVLKGRNVCFNHAR